MVLLHQVGHIMSKIVEYSYIIRVFKIEKRAQMQFTGCNVSIICAAEIILFQYPGKFIDIFREVVRKNSCVFNNPCATLLVGRSQLSRSTCMC